MGDDWLSHYQGGFRDIEHNNDRTVVFRERNASSSLDLEHVPADVELTITLPGTRRDALTLRHARIDQRVKVQGSMKVVVEDGTLGRLTVEQTPGEVTVAGNVGHLLVCCPGRVTVAEGMATTVEVQNGTLAGNHGRFDVVKVVGNVKLPNKVGVLRAASADAEVTGDGTLSVQRLEGGRRKSCHNRLSLTGAGAKPWRVSVDVIVDVTTLLLNNVDLKVNASESPFVLAGSGTLTVPKDVTLADVTINREVTANLHPGSTILRLSGTFRPITCKSATVMAVPGGSFEYGGIVRTKHSTAGGGRLEAATLRGVEIPVTSDGRRYLRELADAAIVDPYLDHLPAFDAEKWPRLFARRKRTGTDTQRKELSDSAFFTQELAALAEHKSGSGSVRTRVSWAAYRARQLDSSSRWERWGLAIFRWLGYGQRPGSPALSWLAMSFIGAPLVAWARADFSVVLSIDAAGLRMFVVLFLEMLLSPFVLIRLATEPQSQDLSTFAGQIVLLARALAAIPFVFVAVAVTRFLRADWPWRA